MSMADTFVRWRYRVIPDHLLGEILARAIVSLAQHAFIDGGHSNRHILLRRFAPLSGYLNRLKDTAADIFLASFLRQRRCCE